MLFKFRFGNSGPNPLKFMAPHPQHNKTFSGPLSFSLPSIFSQGCFMLEDANKSCPDVICIRAGFQSSYLWLQMFILMGYCAILLCRPSWPYMHVLSNARTLFFKIYHFSPTEWSLVTSGAKNVTPVETQRNILPMPHVDTVQTAWLWNHGQWALGKQKEGVVQALATVPAMRQSYTVTGLQ